VGCFKYSPVQGAAANDLGEPVDEDVKEDRWQRFMQVAAGISAERLAEKVGREMTVLVDEVDRDGDLAIARGPGDAPEIDGRILVEGGAGLAEGAFVRVKIASAETYDLLARIS